MHLCYGKMHYFQLVWFLNAPWALCPSVQSPILYKHSAHMHTLPSCKETLVSAVSHSVARVGKLGNNDMAVYTKDKCMNTITSLLATRKQQAKWIHLFFCPPESCCSQILSVCLPYVVQASCLVSQPTREIIYSRCLSSSRYMHNMYMLHEVEANCYWENDSWWHLLKAWHKRIGGLFLHEQKYVKCLWEEQGKALMSAEGSVFFTCIKLHSKGHFF